MKKLSTILIIIGIILIAIPSIGHFYTKYKQDQAYQDYLDSLEEINSNTSSNSENSNNDHYSNNSDNNDNSNENTNDTSENTDNTDNAQTNNTENDVIDVSDIPVDAENQEEVEEEISKEEKPKPKLDVIGKIIIEKIDVDMILIDGISDIDLIYGAGHMENTAYPGETGNCAIPAHRGFSFGTYFYRLDELENGDVIEIEYLGNIYEYSVDDKFIIKPTDTYILRQPKDKKMLTLITCDPPVTGTHRLIVTASLIEKESTDAE